MAQIFGNRFGLLVRAGAIGAVPVFVLLVFAWRAVTGMPPPIGSPVQQPLPFSHRHHVLDDGIDCRYCHSDVETSPHAGVPPLSTCMSCHSQLYSDAPVLKPLRDAWARNQPIAWVRVNSLPDFAYFNHSIHVAKGVGCSTCHGRVDEMPRTWRTSPLTMGWCLDCHRAPEKHLRPPDEVFDMSWSPPADQVQRGAALLVQYHIDKPRLTECSTCHR